MEPGEAAEVPGRPLVLAGLPGWEGEEEAIPSHLDAVDSWSTGAPGQTLVRDRKGLVATARNVGRAVATRGWWRRVALDTFRDEIMWTDWRGPGAGQWRAWTDNDYFRCRVQLEADGFAPVSREMARDAVRALVEDNQFNSAQLWLNRLRWDGVPRIDRFLESYCSADREIGEGYLRAVSAYLWTALAGRTMVPGIKADMVPILVGDGGAGKTALVHAIPPDNRFACRIDLKKDDVEIARKLRGCMVAEVAELRGLRGRDSEAVKDFFSAESDKWTPKYQEIAADRRRTCVFVGTTDNDEFLSDPVGNHRRWLPVRVGEILVDRVRADREQLWAEAADRFLDGGVAWQEARDAAIAVNGAIKEFELSDSWEDAVGAWLETPAASDDLVVGVGGTWGEVGFTTREALVFGLGLAANQTRRGEEMRMAQVIRGLGFIKSRSSEKRKWGNRRIWVRKPSTSD